MNSSYSPDGEQRNNFAIEDFFSYTVKRSIATLEQISQILFFADLEANKGFGDRVPSKSDYDRVRSVKHSAKWGQEQNGFSMSDGTFGIIRHDLESVGFFTIDGDKWGEKAQWNRKAKGVRTRITVLRDINLKALAMFARRLMCALIERIGWEAVDKEHHWGGLAAIVRRITGFSLFSMDEDDIEATPEERSVKRRVEFDRLATELNNAIGIDGYYEDVLAVMVRRFGVNWAEGLPW